MEKHTKEKDAVFESVTWEAQNYDAAERKFQEVLEKLPGRGDENLEQFIVEYDSLLKAVRKSHDNEKRLDRKCRELEEELVQSTAKMAAALKLSADDGGAVLSLRKDLEKAWKLVDAGQEKEARLKEAAAAYQQEIANLTRLVEAGAGLSSLDDNMHEDLQRRNEDLARDRDEQVAALATERKELIDAQEKAKKVHEATLKLEDECDTLRQHNATKDLELIRENFRREQLEKDIADMRAQVEVRTQDIKQQQNELRTAEQRIARMEQTIREQQASRPPCLGTGAAAEERATRENNSLVERNQRLVREVQEQMASNARLVADNKQTAIELKQKEEAIRAMQAETAKVVKAKEAAQARAKAIEKQKEEAERVNDQLRAEVKALEREADSMKAKVDSERKRVEEMAREKDALNKQSTKAEGSVHKQADLLRAYENEKKSLEAEIAGYKASSARHEKTIQAMEHDIEAASARAQDAATKVAELLEKIQLQESDIADVQKKLAEAEARLKQQQALYEQVRADRNLCSRNLIAAQDEVLEVRNRSKTLAHQMEQVKAENTRLEAAVSKERFGHARAQQECEKLQAQVTQLEERSRAADAAVKEASAEAALLTAVVAEAEKERVRQRKETEAVVRDRDVLGSQLVRRNDELALLHEKIRLQQSTISQGNAAYRERLAEMRTLQLQLADLVRETSVLRERAAGAEALKREVHGLGRQVLQERAKVQALGQELENPLNVHRWRKLEGSTPAAYEMLMKCQALQRRLITTTEACVEKDAQIQEQEKLYLELKAILARQPGPEAALHISALQAQLREKQKQLESLVGELNMEQAKADEHKDAIARLQKEHVELKRSLLAAKKRERKHKGKKSKIEMLEEGTCTEEKEQTPPEVQMQEQAARNGQILSQNPTEAVYA
ncbi:Cilia- and flagella-associated protein 58 [Coccomyxa sp. Obi]|nr:Cilia- and flagella-associated protein 58 [Coccomyxa sp. Obi]